VTDLSLDVGYLSLVYEYLAIKLTRLSFSTAVAKSANNVAAFGTCVFVCIQVCLCM